LPAAEQAPRDLIRHVAEREAQTERERGNYTYRQTVAVEELNAMGFRTGEYREVRDVIFSPAGKRTEQRMGPSRNTLTRLILTKEDFRDIREIQPFLFTPDQLRLYDIRFRGEETIEEGECYLLQVRPRQTLEGQRLFDGLFWIAKQDFSIVRSEGKAVPEILRTKSENLFPRFTTFRSLVDGKHWFPARTHADDVLPFRTGVQRIRLTILYSNYKRFTAESQILFGEEVRGR